MLNCFNRVFPNRRRSEVEQFLSRYRGDVVQAMEAMLCGDDAISQISWVHCSILVFNIKQIIFFFFPQCFVISVIIYEVSFFAIDSTRIQFSWSISFPSTPSQKISISAIHWNWLPPNCSWTWSKRHQRKF